MSDQDIDPMDGVVTNPVPDRAAIAAKLRPLDPTAVAEDHLEPQELDYVRVLNRRAVSVADALAAIGEAS